MDKRQNYKDLISCARYEEAMSTLNMLIAENPTDDRVLFDRGKLKWRLGDRAGAMSDYSKVGESRFTLSPRVQASAFPFHQADP